MNPLQKPDTFYLTLANPNPKSAKLVSGPCYRVEFELTREEWDWFMEAETKGMVIECACQVAHKNEPEPKRDENTVDALDGQTDKEKKEEEQKGGPLSVRSDRLARDPSFIQFIYGTEPAYKVPDAKLPVDYCRAYIRDRCGVQSRKEFDHDKRAADKFKKLLSSYIHWATENGYDIA